MTNAGGKQFTRIGALYGVRIGVVGLGFASMLLVAIALGPVQFGIFAVMWALAQASAAIVSVGAPAFLLRELPARQEMGVSALPLWPLLRLTLFLPALIAVLLTVCGMALVNALPNMPLTSAQIATSVVFGFTQNFLYCVSVPVRVSRGATFSMALRDGTPQVAILMAPFALPIVGNISADAVMTIATVILITVGASVTILSLLNNMCAFGVAAPGFAGRPTAFWANAVLGTATANLDILLAGCFLPHPLIGAYAILKRLTNFISLPQIISNWTIAVPASAAHARRNGAALDRIATQGVALAFPLAVGASIALAFTSTLWAPLFHLQLTFPILFAFTLMLISNILSVGFGATLTLASQCGLEARSFVARVASTLVLAVGIWGLGVTGLLDVASIAGIVALSTFALNATVWAALKQHLNLDTSVLRLLKLSHSAPSALTRTKSPP